MQISVILLGFGIGILTGATGIGGGTLLAPALIFVMRVNPFVAVGTDLFVSVITKIVGAMFHRKAHSVVPEAVWPMCVAGVIGAALGGVALWFLKSHVNVTSAEVVLRRTIGIALLVCCAAIALSWGDRWRRDAAKGRGVFGWAGGAIGLITAMTGVGVGSLSVPVLYLSSKGRDMAAVVGTSLIFGAAVTGVASVAHIVLRDVNYGLSLWLLVGSIPGVAVGSAIAIRGNKILRPVIIALLVISAVKLLA